MKTLAVFFIAIIISFAFPYLSTAQQAVQRAGMKVAPQQAQLISPTKVRLKTAKGIKILDYVPKSKLQEGRNFVRIGNRRMFVGVKNGKVLNVKVMNQVGKWGPNILGTASGGGLEFTCVGGICVCSGDYDCNNMFTSTVCGDAAVCIDDKCYCAQN